MNSILLTRRGREGESHRKKDELFMKTTFLFLFRLLLPVSWKEEEASFGASGEKKRNRRRKEE